MEEDIQNYSPTVYSLNYDMPFMLLSNILCLSNVNVCFFVSNKRQNGSTDRAQIFCGTSREPREGLWMI